jgi:hypothetical protein
MSSGPDGKPKTSGTLKTTYNRLSLKFVSHLLASRTRCSRSSQLALPELLAPVSAPFMVFVFGLVLRRAAALGGLLRGGGIRRNIR